MNDEELAQRLSEKAWKCYCAGVGGKSWDGTPLRTWQEMVVDEDPKTQIVVSAWRLAALGVAEEFMAVVDARLNLR